MFLVKYLLSFLLPISALILALAGCFSCLVAPDLYLCDLLLIVRDLFEFFGDLFWNFSVIYLNFPWSIWILGLSILEFFPWPIWILGWSILEFFGDLFELFRDLFEFFGDLFWIFVIYSEIFLDLGSNLLTAWLLVFVFDPFVLLLQSISWLVMD